MTRLYGPGHFPDYAQCVHIRAGQELGRGLMQWWDNGAAVRDELPSADHRDRAYAARGCTVNW